VYAWLIQFLALINKKKCVNHAAILFENKDHEQFVFEIRMSGTRLSSFEGFKKRFVGSIYIQDVITYSHHADVYFCLEKYYDYSYSVLDAIGSAHFENKFLKFLNPLFNKIGNDKDTKTFCSALIKCLEELEKHFNQNITLLEHIRQNYNSFEKITPAMLYEIIAKVGLTEIK